MIKKISYILDRKQKISLLLLLFLILGGAFMELLGVSAILPLINLVLSPAQANQKWYFQLLNTVFHFSTARQMVVFLSILLAVIYLLKNIYLTFMYNEQYRFIFDNQRRLAVRMLDCYMKQEYLFHVTKNVADLQRNITNDVNCFYTAVLYFLQFLAEISVCIALVIFLMITDIKTTMVVAVLVGLFILFFTKVFQKVLIAKGEKNRTVCGTLNKWILQSFAGIKEIKVSNKENFFIGNYESNYREFATIQRQQSLLTILPRPIMETICICGLLLVLSIQVYAGNSELSTFIPVLSVFAVAAFRMLPSFNRMTGYISGMMFDKPSIDAVYRDLKEIENTINTKSKDNNETIISFPVSEDIIMRQISFRYPNTDKWILNKADLIIPQNKSVAVIGESGAGKTTLVDILLGILVPNSGAISIADINILEHIQSWHNYIGYIPQNIYLMDDTIRTNIAFGVPAELIDEELMWKAIKEAQLEDFIKSIPNGLDAEIGDRGVRISGGQRQRIGIARALYRQPQILILDEATSALDNETEKAVMESIDSLQGTKTMIIIAHRLTTIKNCDYIYEVKDGKLLSKKKEELF